MSEILGVALAGTGAFALHQHLPNLVRIPECRLIGLWNRSPQRLAEVAARYPAPLVTTDYQAILADARIGLVVIAAGDAVQAGLAIAALDAGKHVYVEKPLATTPADGAAVEAAVRRSGRRLAVGFNRRFAPAYRRTAAILDAHGGARNLHYRFVDDAKLRWATALAPGALIGHDVCHIFDCLAWLCRTRIDAVACLAARPDDEAMLLRLADGAVATVMAGGFGSLDMPKERLEAVGQGGGVTVEDFVELRCFGWPGHPARETFAGHIHPDREMTHAALYQALGLEAALAFRRGAWELRQRLDAGALTDAEADKARRYLAQCVPTFTVDKGWLPALREFVLGIRDGRPTDHATAGDAFTASRVVAAAERSRAQGGAWMTVEPPPGIPT